MKRFLTSSGRYSTLNSRNRAVKCLMPIFASLESVSVCFASHTNGQEAVVGIRCILD